MDWTNYILGVQASALVLLAFSFWSLNRSVERLERQMQELAHDMSWLEEELDREPE